MIKTFHDLPPAGVPVMPLSPGASFSSAEIAGAAPWLR